MGDAVASARSEDAGQCRDALLLRLLKMPPQSRADIAEHARQAKAKAIRVRGKSGRVRKREPSV